MTRVLYSRLYQKQLKKVPRHVQTKAKYWVMEVEYRGIHEVAKLPGYHDEPLRG